MAPTRNQRQPTEPAPPLGFVAVVQLCEAFLGPHGRTALILDSSGTAVLTKEAQVLFGAAAAVSRDPPLLLAADAIEAQFRRCGCGCTALAALLAALTREGERLIGLRNIAAHAVVRGLQRAARRVGRLLGGEMQGETLVLEPHAREPVARALSALLASKQALLGASTQKLAELLADAVHFVGAGSAHSLAFVSVVGPLPEQSCVLSGVCVLDGVSVPPLHYAQSGPSGLRVAAADDPSLVAPPSASPGGLLRASHSPAEVLAMAEQYEQYASATAQRLQTLGVNLLLLKSVPHARVAAALEAAAVLFLAPVPSAVLQRAAAAVGGRVVAAVRELEDSEVGSASRLVEKTLPDGRRAGALEGAMLRCATVVLCSLTNETSAATERVSVAALRALKFLRTNGGRVVPGGACMWTALAEAAESEAALIETQERHSCAAFGAACRSIGRRVEQCQDASLHLEGAAAMQSVVAEATRTACLILGS
eukprot:TRINITY_DN8374_c0_g1_i1.p1 TRINITY_DN8374_c0_g1~~TRINITY_DN8374_c0_g1_i1.p1  ORF type:complete len:488 (+),score=102.25 TRINITY_DN8374_c0_g1_i1:23-1465(+)